MNDRKKRTRSLCLALLLALSSCLLVPPAQAAGEDIEVKLNRVAGTYDGSSWKPSVQEVKVDGEVTESYTVSYGENRHPPSGTVTVTVTKEDGTVASETVTFPILPRKIYKKDLSMGNLCSKEYDGTSKATPEITITNGLLGDDAVSVTYGKAVYDDSYAGSNKILTVSGLQLTGKNQQWYALEDENMVFTDDVGQITPKSIQTPETKEIATGQKIDLKTLIPEVGSDVSFVLSSEPGGCTLSGSELRAGNETGQVTIFANAGERNVDGKGEPEYQGISNLPIYIVIQDQIEQPDFTLHGPTSVTYGETAQFRVAGGAGNGKVTYHVERAGLTGTASIDSNGRLTATQAGEVMVYALREGDSDYEGTYTDSIILKIRPAQLTIRVRDKSAQVLDPVPELTKSDYTVSGLVGGDKLQVEPTLFYAAAPNMLWEGEVPIRADYAVAPDLINYNPKINYVDGTLTIRKQPQYDVTVRTPQNGTLTVTPTSAREGETVTVIARPDRGYELRALTATSGRKNITLHEKTANLYTFTMPDGDVRLSASFLRDLPFVDVPEKAWYYEDVAYVYGNDLMDGTTPLTFSPDVTTSRGMIVTMLYRMDGRPTPPGWQPFADVDQDSYYADAVAWAAWNGVVNGMAPDRFAPWDKITRQQLAAILYRYAQYKNCHLVQGSDLSKFQDGHKVSDYAKVPMAWANKEGLIQGKGSNTLDPNGLATRAEAAATLHRFCEDVLP